MFIRIDTIVSLIGFAQLTLTKSVFVIFEFEKKIKNFISNMYIMKN